ncbi:nicotinate-nucleotide--dimethylbenzimidazole phosphoribosyltransferase [Ardenticatena maritima]|uniref:Nicotinate-nucleotide--dimethylbenzimidazole phosphoribosyltransferase n=1 Tax=Ardenticatena maritima TaxID=872965 RepID=A0A0M9UC59_9CHLR|nr:nicotinate-nucleotide--dimethylbenzimidazole phosphoribosyltransferase [Ardenticatena maritima]KPL87579.1 nicotinate-nucleotide--dimethylbenzimidazole phosphoribosyltransferase [Ardenticatena maritima]GAP62594.1 nicotinate-nucleotide--dimethylbenzimidazole phosphoribosyltransferase [Ardenticatena maritima]
MQKLNATIAAIRPLDKAAMQAARERQDQLTKPRGSLGRLETLSVQLAGILGTPRPRLRDKAVVTMAGDHGVVAEGVSAFPQEVTPQMVYNFLRGGAAINVLARHAGARVVVVDMGVAVDLDPHPDLVVKKIGYGTGNIAVEPAMTREQAIAALEAGIEVVEAEVARGLDVLATGDMGIGNTTPSAAIAAAITGRAPGEIVGRGTGLDEVGVARKIGAVQRALAANRPDPYDGVDVLAKVGGFEIGGLAGAILGAAAAGRPVVVDGFISTAAAMIAVSLAPQVRPYLIAAHHSQERGHRIMLDWLGLHPLLNLDLRLGEGTGAALAFHVLDAACAVLNEMATFAEAGVSEEIEKTEKEGRILEA